MHAFFDFITKALSIIFLIIDTVLDLSKILLTTSAIDKTNLFFKIEIIIV